MGAEIERGEVMKVGVLGSGDVAKSLAAGFLKHGHEVMLGTRAPNKLADWIAQNPKAKTGAFADSAQFGDVVVLAVKGSAAEMRSRRRDLPISPASRSLTRPIRSTSVVGCRRHWP